MAKKEVTTNDEGGKREPDSALFEIKALAYVLGAALELANNINAERPDAGNNDEVSTVLYGCEDIVTMIKNVISKVR